MVTWVEIRNTEIQCFLFWEKLTMQLSPLKELQLQLENSTKHESPMDDNVSVQDAAKEQEDLYPEDPRVVDDNVNVQDLEKEQENLDAEGPLVFLERWRMKGKQ